jgi:ABC-type transport system involved in cytochrome c biogenesis permease subunit
MSTLSHERSFNPTADVGSADLTKLFWQVMTALGSLRIAVAMFGLGTLLLLVGTLAQDEDTIVDVKRIYFSSWVAYVPLDVFVPNTVFPHETKVPLGFFMPGGALIGITLLINLFAAKLTRFRMYAKGKRLVLGMLITLIGFGLIGLVILGAHLGDGLQGEPPFAYEWLWLGSKGLAFLLTVMSVGWVVMAPPKNRIILYSGILLAAILSGLSLFLVFTGDAFRIPDPGLRIVWQLTKSLGVGFVLMTGLTLLFGQRGGNVLIHLGVGLLMVGQFIFGDAQREERMTIVEGQKTCMAAEIDTVELVVIDRSPDNENRVVAFNQHLLKDSLARKTLLTVDGLPFSIRVDKWIENSTVGARREAPDADSDEAKMTGLIKKWEIKEIAKSGGAMSDTNIASAYYTVINKADGQELGRYAASQWYNDDHVVGMHEYDSVEMASKKYEIGLQFRRNYKDYTVTLKDVVLEQYTNTAIPKDYSSYIDIRDKDGNLVQDGRVWMNSPMRFRGETFYQSSYTPKNKSPYGVEQTVLQVVTNAGWLIPYVSCVLVGLGMLFHFSGTFARFASRYERGAIEIPTASEIMVEDPSKRTQWIIVGLCAFGLSAYFYSLFLKPKPDRDQVDYRAIGQISVNYGGRVKPLASAGAEILQILSNKPYALMVEEPTTEEGIKKGEPKETRIPPEKWLFAVMMNEDWIRTQPLIRIDATDVTTALNLTRVKSNRYSYQQVASGIQAIWPRMMQIMADSQERKKLSFEDQSLAEVFNKILTVNTLIDAYRPIAPESIKDGDIVAFRREIQELQERVERIREAKVPTILPSFRQRPVAAGEKAPPLDWDAFGPLFFDSLPKAMEKEKTHDLIALEKFIQLNMTYQENSNSGVKINRAVDEFRKAAVEAHGEEVMRPSQVVYEEQFFRMDLFAKCGRIYLLLGILAAVSFVVMPRSFRTIALCLCIGAFLMHTYGIWARIVISERPPVVNLYSAAVFIGWAVVLACIVSELFYPIGVSLIFASVFGYLTLLVAYGLGNGDTMPVLQAVLDTQFWLSTHVISVTLGYSATFLAGLIGIALVVAYGIRTFNSSVDNERLIAVLYRLCYAVVCFGIFFSFVGTVLGGLWGDDSWGRFWGWDPKENGALMIVLWNALLLHARWDKLVGPLGFANLAVFGNIITAWSMFGTNQLGIGLHAYGAFEGKILFSLGIWGVTQLLVIIVGLILVFQNRYQTSSELTPT